ncbi:MAG: thioredoxin family protein [Bacteroidetes bacterium]|nr:thioredoxin family protein [Bacteroidota bacterium]
MTFRHFAPVFLLVLAGCSMPEDSRIKVSLEPSDMTGEYNLYFSPVGKKIPLTKVDDGLEGSYLLGSPNTSQFRVRLEKSEGAQYFDRLWVDSNRDGVRDSLEVLTTTPSLSRYSMWSSFTSVVWVSVVDSTTQEETINPYPMSLWYVEAMREGDVTEQVLRFSRTGWMQGRVDLDGIQAHIRLSESHVDGLYTLDDSWTLALPDSFANIFAPKQDRPGRRHAWLGEKAYRIDEVHPNGRTVYLMPIDPGVTRAQELLDDDQLAVDRQAPHSGTSIAFRKEFVAAEKEAKSAGKTLFIDFETVWCGPCATMEEWVFTADSVVEASASLISVKVDGDDFPEIVKRFEVAGYPTMIKMSPSGEIIGRLVGYQGVNAMTAFLKGD